MRGRDAERVEQADGVVGHVVERVRRLRIAAERGGDVRQARRLHLGGQAEVAVVEADDVEAALDELRRRSRRPS